MKNILNKNQKIVYSLTLLFLIVWSLGILDDMADISKAPEYHYWPDRLVYLLIFTVLHLIWIKYLADVTQAYFKIKEYKNFLSLNTVGILLSYLYIFLLFANG